MADTQVSIIFTSTTAVVALVATSWLPRPSLPHLGGGGLFPYLREAMSLLALKVETEAGEKEEEDGKREAEGKNFKLVLDGGGNIITAKCPSYLTKRQYVFKCGRWWWWRPCQTSRQGCRQVGKSILVCIIQPNLPFTKCVLKIG